MTTGFIHNPHDRFFRSAMAQVTVAREFFQSHLPAEIRDKIDFSTLKAEKDTFVDDVFKASEADLLYSVKLIDNSTAYIYLLCEHQSNVDKEIAFRVLVYLIEIMKHHRAQHPGEPLPIVIPTVLYTGADPWTAPLDIFPLFGEQESLARRLWPPAYQLIDVHRLTDKELKLRDFSGLVEYAFKHAKARDFEKALSELLHWLSEISKKDFEQAVHLGKNMVFYIANMSEALDKTTFNRLAEKHLGASLRGEMMTLAAQFRHEGETTVLRRQLAYRFGSLDTSYVKKLEQAKPEQLLIWEERILSARTPREVFDD